MFGRKKQPRIVHATEDEDRRASAALEEILAGREKRNAQAHVEKWDRIVRSMTSRGATGPGRDVAIRNREAARESVRDAEVRELNAKRQR